MRKKRKVILILVVLLILLVIFPYIKVEYLTIKYGEDFVGLEQQTNMLNPSKYHKVMEYSSIQAKVFYVSDTGTLITFTKEGTEWVIKSWETVWSTTGSADEFFWPYYR